MSTLPSFGAVASPAAVAARPGVARGQATIPVTCRLSGWGRYPSVEAAVASPARLADIAIPARGSVICRGEGRSYGDAAVSSRGLVLLSRDLNALCRFDEATGVLTAEAGMTISDLLDRVVPLGWFPPVTPGTKHVSLGGAIAADVHGKNHHRDGSIGNHVLGLELILADGATVQCSPRANADLFWATIGGMGLTGIIARVTLQLMRIETSSIAAQHFKAPNLETAFRWLGDCEHDDQYTVAWIDCLSRGRVLGRSIVMRGHHAGRHEAEADLSVKGASPFNIPLDLPSFVMNPLSVSAFNQLYYTVQGRKTRPFLVDYDRFFYPLDMVRNWNRMYGRRGFLQYQFMVPDAQADTGIRLVLERVAQSRRAIFLAVLKRFGPGNPGPLSFPDSGYTLAMDLPMTGPDVLRLLDDMDEIVLRYGGRVYLAKDARLAPERFRSMYPRLGEWLRVKYAVDPDGRFSSDLSARLGLDTLAAAVPGTMSTAVFA